MKRVSATAVTTLFLFLAPGTVAVLIPWRITRWRLSYPSWDSTPLRILGALLLTAGTAGLLDCFTRFVRKGHGTPAPFFPTETLVVTGLYRFVRNPMYVAILAMLLGQVLCFGNVSLLVYTAGAWLATHLFVCLYEEPTLRRTYGGSYDTYRAHVPRWLPRFTPWRGPDGSP